MELQGKYNKDCKVFGNELDSNELTLLYEFMNAPACSKEPIRIMADHHLGKGSLIGYTQKLIDAVMPMTVGVDIGCSITCCILDKKIGLKDYPIIEHRIRKDIPFGFNINKERQFEMKEFFKFIQNFYNKARSQWSDMILDFDISEKGITNFLKRIRMDEGTFYKSLGSIGSGNHFVELGDTEDVSAFTIHCGSRNLGIKVANFWTNVAKEPESKKVAFKMSLQTLKKTCKNKKELPRLIQELKERLDNDVRFCSGYLRGLDMQGYITDMVIATAYAQFNHLVITRKIEDILRHTCNAKVVEKICSIHNYIDFEDHIIRKGAIRAYKGEKLVLSFNMRDGLAICVGKSNEDFNFSSPHGCGRILSRNAAKKELDLNDFKEQMKGIYSTSVCKETLDEAPNAYKPYQEILKAIEPTAEVLYLVKPTINLKAV